MVQKFEVVLWRRKAEELAQCKTVEVKEKSKNFFYEVRNLVGSHSHASKQPHYGRRVHADKYDDSRLSASRR